MAPDDIKCLSSIHVFLHQKFVCVSCLLASFRLFLIPKSSDFNPYHFLPPLFSIFLFVNIPTIPLFIKTFTSTNFLTSFHLHLVSLTRTIRSHLCLRIDARSNQHRIEIKKDRRHQEVGIKHPVGGQKKRNTQGRRQTC